MSFHGNKGISIFCVVLLIFFSMFFASKKIEYNYEIKKNEKIYSKMMEENTSKNQKEIQGNYR